MPRRAPCPRTLPAGRRFRPRPSAALLATLAAAVAAPVPGGCESAPSGAGGSPPAPRPAVRSAAPVELSITADATAVTAGQTVTLKLEAAGGLPPRPDVHWIASGGELVPADDGLSARVRFREAGAYRVTATLFERDSIVATRTIGLTVRPPRP
ncbi:MAG: immunoglobulin domain-containing protein [Planctomycetota bacterium]